MKLHGLSVASERPFALFYKETIIWEHFPRNGNLHFSHLTSAGLQVVGHRMAFDWMETQRTSDVPPTDEHVDPQMPT